MKGDSSCHVVMERARKGKAPVPAGVWALAVRGKGKVAVKEAAGDKVVVAARAKERAKERVRVKGAARGKDKTADRISELLRRKRGALRCQVETEQAPWEWAP